MDHLVQHLLLSPVMCTSSLLENHFKIKINIPFTCNIIIKVLPGSHTRQRSGLHLLKTAFNLGILQNKIHTQLKEKKTNRVPLSTYTCNSSKYFFRHSLPKINLFCYSVSRNQTSQYHIIPFPIVPPYLLKTQIQQQSSNGIS